MQIKHLIKPCEVGVLSRPCDADETLVLRAIEEAELLDVKPKLGDELFLRLMTHVEYDLLLNGGEYEGACGKKFIFAGLKRALAYYVWARCVKTGTNHLTRYGFVEKRDDNSAATEFKQRQAAYNDAFATGDGYMKECLDYIQARPDIFADYTLQGKTKSNRVIYRIIGD